MSNLPQSRNRNLPPPAEPADVRRRVMTPLAGPEEPGERKTSLLRHVVAMLVVGGLVFGGIRLYQRALETNTGRYESILNSLQATGKQVWASRGFLDLPADTEERRKDRDDLPRIFLAAQAGAQKARVAPRILAIEADPLFSGGIATHQVNYYFGDELRIMLTVRYNGETESFSFIGVHNRFVPSRKELEQEGKAPAPVLTPPAVPPGLPPAAASPGEQPPGIPAPPLAPDSPPPAEKVSEPPAIPR
jgi:hypothetical protein